MFAPGLNEKSISRESKIVTPELLVVVVTKQGWRERHLTNIVGILKGNHDVWQHSHLNDIAKVYFKSYHQVFIRFQMAFLCFRFCLKCEESCKAGNEQKAEEN